MFTLHVLILMKAQRQMLRIEMSRRASLRMSGYRETYPDKLINLRNYHDSSFDVVKGIAEDIDFSGCITADIYKFYVVTTNVLMMSQDRCLPIKKAGG